jgi:hypothetical protein
MNRPRQCRKASALAVESIRADMPKRRIERFYYRNSLVRMENREVEGQLHGLCRIWHYNGQLA